VDWIINGVGGYARLTYNPLRPLSLTDPTVCQDSMKALLSALATLQSREGKGFKKPVLLVISGNGIADKGGDIPALLVPLSIWLLPVPAQDKKEMERVLLREMGKGKESVIAGFVAVRPSLLMDVKVVGVHNVRVGVEKEGRVDKSGVGFSINRTDVGEWIFEVLIQGWGGDGKGYLNKFVSITS